MNGWRDRVVVITGASAGVGRALTRDLARWYVDRYVARFGYEAQQTDDPRAADRPDNLFAPVPHDYGAHGRFDARARSSGTEWWIVKHRGAALAGVLALGVTALTALRR